MAPASSSSSDSTSPQPRGRLLEKDRAEIERLELANFNKSLRINNLEELVLLLQKGEGFTEESVLRELTQLQTTLKASEDELHQQTAFWIQTVDELGAQLQQARAIATDGEEGGQNDVEGPGTEPAPVISQHDYDEKVKLQEQLDNLARAKQEQEGEIGYLQRQNATLSSQLEEQGRATHDVKRDYERAMDIVYELETRAKQQNYERASIVDDQVESSEQVGTRGFLVVHEQIVRR
jgi:SMC interacting uncharacterized protein involved in chromosome segregation